MISLQPGTHKDFELSLSDVNKAFADVGKLTGPETWPMWKFRVETALQTIVDFYASRAHRTVPNEVTRAVFNVMTCHIGDTVMANYMNENMPHVRMEKLRERFDPKTTVADANEIFQLFHLRRPVHEMDKLLDDAQNLYSRIVAKGVVVPSHIFYSHCSRLRHLTSPFTSLILGQLYTAPRIVTYSSTFTQYQLSY